MVEQRKLTAIIHRENGGFVSHCPELDVASQGDTVEEARANLVEALTLFLEVAPTSEVDEQLRSDIYISQVEIPVGSA